jgi:glucose-6-phosphate isomerase
MGVELGKVLAKAILAQLNSPEDVKGHDSSVSILHNTLQQTILAHLINLFLQTTGLIHYYQKYRKE